MIYIRGLKDLVGDEVDMGQRGEDKNNVWVAGNSFDQVREASEEQM